MLTTYREQTSKLIVLHLAADLSRFLYVFCESLVRGVENAIPNRSTLNERAQPIVPRGFSGFLASKLLVWSPSQRRKAMFEIAFWSVELGVAGSYSLPSNDPRVR